MHYTRASDQRAFVAGCAQELRRRWNGDAYRCAAAEGLRVTTLPHAEVQKLSPRPGRVLGLLYRQTSTIYVSDTRSDGVVRSADERARTVAHELAHHIIPDYCTGRSEGEELAHDFADAFLGLLA